MTHQFIDVKQAGGVLTITMDDPTTRNAIGAEMADEINAELDRLQSDPALRVLVLTGRDPAFCSGANVKRMSQSAEQRSGEPEPEPTTGGPSERLAQLWERQAARGAAPIDGPRSVAVRLNRLEKPSIAAVNGYAMGLGMGLALCCDIRFASEEARFSEAFIRNGLVPADGSCWQLPRMIGLSNTLLLQYTGDAVSAEDALRMGLATKVVPHEELMGEAMALAQRLAQGPTYTMALIKRLVQASLKTDFEESLDLATAAQEIARQTEDHREGVRAFVEKRKPAFKGR